MKNLVIWMLESIKKYGDKVFIVNKEKEYSYNDYYKDMMRVYKSIDGYKVLIKPTDKYFYTLAVGACLFKHTMPFLSNPSSNVYDNYKFDLVIDDGFISNALNNKFEEYVYNDFSNNDVACVLLSSGTSQVPKPIVLSHKAMARNIEAGFEIFYIGSNWKFVSILPLDHAFGITSDFLDLMFSGATICYSYTIIEFFMNLKRYNPNQISIPINILKTICQMLDESGKQVLGNNMEQILVGGSKCSQELVDYFKKYNVTVCTSYGLTECAPCVSISSPKYFKENSDGKVFSCHKIVIDEDGRILVKGDSIMLNYLDLYEKGIICDVVDTKDIGYVDEDGYIFVTGRADNLIVLDNGFKIQPESFEKDLMKVPGIIDCVIYYYDKMLYLDVIKNNELVEDLNKKYDYLEININFVSDIKKNVLGKIDRGYYKNGKKEENARL